MGYLVLAVVSVFTLTLCNVIVISAQWEYSYTNRNHKTTRAYEATDNFLHTCIGLLLPSGMSLLLGYFSVTLFWGIGIVFLGCFIASLIAMQLLRRAHSC